MKKILNKLIGFYLVMLILFSYMPAYAEHVHQAAMCGKTVKYYDHITKDTHTYVVASENLCSCGELLGYIENSTKTGKHFFMFGKCNKCGYKKGEHIHESVFNDSTRYENLTSTTHTLVLVSQEVCADCGNCLSSLREERKVVEHTFQDGICTECKYECHEHEAGMCGNKVGSYYRANNDDTHSKIVQRENLCTICGQKLPYLDETVESTEYHNYVKFECTVCGHFDSRHVHTPTYSTLVGEPVYTGITSKVHTKCVYIHEECECGKVISERKEEQITEEHDFYRNTCKYCGYRNIEHVHSAARNDILSQSYVAMSDSLHKVTTTYQDVCSCGEKLSINQKEETQEHNFENGYCVTCQYKQPHVHVASKCGTGGEQYEDITAKTHTFVTYTYELCGCGYNLGKISESRTTSEHDFNGDTCVYCGYVRHKHGYDVPKGRYTNYQSVSEDEHVKQYYAGDYYCDCGAYTGKGRYEETTEPHNFENGVCVQCKKVKHQHITVEASIPETYYGAINEKYHVVLTISGGAYCSCGEYIFQDDSAIAYDSEHHDFSGIVCRQCGYNRSDKYISDAIRQAFLGDFSDETNLLGIAGQVVVGEIPIIGTIADVRDLVASIKAGDSEGVIASTIGFLPLCGGLKYSDEVYDVVKRADDVVDATKYADDLYDVSRVVTRNSDKIDDCVDVVYEVKRASDTSQAFNGYNEFKKAYGAAGDGLEWHHIVEQSQALKSGFDLSKINDAQNIVAIDASIHRKISGYYSRIVPGTGMSFRDYISKNYTFEQQQKIGEYVLKMFGVEIK